MQRLLAATILFAAVAISGCSSMSQGECVTMDWRTIGYEDGVAGYAGNRIGQYRKACSKYGVAPNLDQYQLGRSQGLREFCKPANGFRVGARGNSYNGVCPADLDREFAAAYESGHQLYVLRSRVARANEQLHEMSAELDKIDSDMVKVGAEIISPEINTEQRAQLLVETKHLAERRGALKADIPQLERDRDAYERELVDYRASLTYVE